MKKLFKLVFMLSLVITLVACGSSNKENNKVKLVGDMNGAYYEIILDAQGDKVITQTQITTITLADFDEDTQQLLIDSLEEYAKVYDEYDYVEYSSNMNDTEIIETIVLDLSKPKYIKELSEAGLLPIEGDKIVSYISLEKTVENIEEMGLEKQ